MSTPWLPRNALQLARHRKPRHIVEDEGSSVRSAAIISGSAAFLRARYRDGAIELAAADNTNAVHATPLAMHKLVSAHLHSRSGDICGDLMGPLNANHRHSGALTKVSEPGISSW
jgi:hypothetical protein